MKKVYHRKKQSPLLWIIPVLAIISAIGIIPLNLFVLQLPEWISIPLSAAVLFTTVFFCVKRKRRLGGKIVLSFFGVIAVCLSLIGTYCNPYWNGILFRSDIDWYSKNYDYALTYEQAKSDLDYAMKYLNKLHPAFYQGFPSDISDRYDKAVQRLQSTQEITVNVLAQEIQGIFSLLHDAHTNVYITIPDSRYMKYIYEHNQAGDILKGINGQTWDQLIETYSDKVSYEVKEYGIQRLSRFVNTAEGLAYLNISVENGVVYNYETENGEKIEQYAEESDFLTYDEYCVFNGIQDQQVQEYSFVSYEIDTTRSLAVLTLDSCEYNSEYINTVKNMFSEVKEKGIKNVAVDLRYNGGGNSMVANEFFRYLNIDSYKEWAWDWRLGWFMLNIEQCENQNNKYDELIFDGDLYLLTSVETFSSAMNFAEYVKDNQLGTIIGETCGNAPDSYGDISAFKLPNSGLCFQISTKKWYRIDNTEGLIDPDIPCDEREAMDILYEECENH